MGRALIEATIETIDAELIGGTVRSGSSLIGADAGELAKKRLKRRFMTSRGFFLITSRLSSILLQLIQRLTTFLGA